MAVYRSPNQNFKHFIDKINEALENLTQRNHSRRYIVAGDFNTNILKDGVEQSLLIETFTTYGMQPLMREASRTTETSSSCIDNIFSNINIEEIFSKETKSWCMSDHYCQVLKIKNPVQEPRKPEKHIYRRINEQNTYYFKEYLTGIEWARVFKHRNAKEAYTVFHTTLTAAFDKFFPRKEKINKPKFNKRPMWISKKIMSMKNTLEALQTIARVEKSQQSAEVFKSYKRSYFQEIEENHRNYNAYILNNADNKQKAIWKIINTKTKTSNTKECKLNADDLNLYFATIGEKTSDSIKKIDKDPCDFLKACKSNAKSFWLAPVSEEEVTRLIRSLKCKNSKDVYDMSTSFLKEILLEITNPLTMLINKSFIEGYFPDELKVAKIIPVPKEKGEVENINKFRPISILPTISKVFEAALKNRLMKYLEQNDLFSESQHGYRSGRSTITAALDLYKKITRALDNREMVEVAMCDLSKAFDTLPHKLILQKLQHYGIRGITQEIFKSYLENRTQIVKWNEKWSKPLPTRCGVPQGSILGPLLFIIYVNDLPINMRVDGQCLYADDTSFCIKEETEDTLKPKMRKILEDANEWFTANKLKLNGDKTQELFISSKPTNVTSVKFLGFYLNSKASWKDHIQETCKNLASALFSIRRIKNISTPQAARVTYFANFHSKATYGILLWGTSSDADKIFVLQKKAIRILCQMNYRESCRPAFKQQQILTIPSAYILSCLRYVHNHLHEFIKNGSYHEHNTRHADALSTPYHRLKVSQHSIDHWGPKLYNKLQDPMKRLAPALFEKKVKDALLEMSYYSIQEFLDNPPDLK